MSHKSQTGRRMIGPLLGLAMFLAERQAACNNAV